MNFGITLPNTKYGHLMPQEDTFLIEKDVFCVADGITRDPISPLDFEGLTIEDGLKNYPNPSGARMAADLFCQEFVKNIGHEESSDKAFIKANSAIAELNKKYIKKVDYLVNDFYACVASGGTIINKKLKWGQICDCGIIIFDKNGNKKFQTENGMTPFKSYIKGKEQRWGNPERRKYIRSQFRNNPEQIVEGKLVSYGALTGEKTAAPFIKSGTIDLSSGDLVIFYSDGFENLVVENGFFDALYKNNEESAKKDLLEFDKQYSANQYEEFGHERTLIAVRVD